MNSSKLTKGILESLESEDGQSSIKLANDLKEDHQKVVGAIKSLQSLGNVIRIEQKSIRMLQLTQEGKQIADNGSHEARIFEKVPSDKFGIHLQNFNQDNESVKIGINQAIKSGWLKVEKSQVYRVIDNIIDQTRIDLKAISDGDTTNVNEDIMKDLKKRKLVDDSVLNYFVIWRSTDFSTNVVKLDAELTHEMLVNKEYENRIFKPYNFDALGATIPSGHLHPLLKVRSEFISILTEMGFSEMPTNRFVESSFWNFDALFVPQKHPARDIQDTFFMSRPQTCNGYPREYMERVKKVHTDGDYGSIGYGTSWIEDEAKKNILRTHTTAISAKILYELGQCKPFQPVKKFSIDRVFRNETLDATHLAEFHQVEGFVADRDLSLGHLIGVMKEFFKRLGIDQLRFKPAFNPYTEPSMEVFAFHKGLKKWVEVGNSGIFRPEMLLPMELPPDVRVIAWGLSLERPTMIRYGIDNIRSLVGHKVDLKMVYNNSLCRLDKQ